MRVGSLFSGIGGLELGLEWAGMQTVWQVERDPYARKVLAKHWPNIERYADVRGFDATNAAGVDLVCGGFPCQPHSLAGKRKASEDSRDLWGEFARVIREAEPRWVVAENVPGLLSSEAGRYFGKVLRDLASLGYDAEWFCLSASDFGAPHRRERVFIVAHSNGKRIKKQDVSTLSDERRRPCDPSWWLTEPDVGRVAYGVPSGVDRLKCLGNAVVPQVAYRIGQMIMQKEKLNGQDN